jgi:hypothetical protein
VHIIGITAAVASSGTVDSVSKTIDSSMGSANAKVLWRKLNMSSDHEVATREGTSDKVRHVGVVQRARQGRCQDKGYVQLLKSQEHKSASADNTALVDSNFLLASLECSVTYWATFQRVKATKGKAHHSSCTCGKLNTPSSPSDSYVLRMNRLN